MPAFAFDGQDKSISTGKNWASSYTNSTDRIITNQVQADNAINIVHCPFFDHWFSSTNALFGWLEDKFHIASEFCAALIQDIGYRKQNRGMSIMPAGMHFAIVCRTIVYF